jgi:hypothetical protein
MYLVKSFNSSDMLWDGINIRRKTMENNLQLHSVIIPDEVIGFFNWHNPSSRTMALGSTRTEMSTRDLPVGKGRSAGKTDNITAICEPTM